jgi:hypothetical protein
MLVGVLEQKEKKKKQIILQPVLMWFAIGHRRQFAVEQQLLSLVMNVFHCVSFVEQKQLYFKE